MKKVLFVLSVLIMMSLRAAAQHIPQDATLYYKAGNVYTTDGDIKLTKANALNYFPLLDDYENYWLKGKRLFTAGIVVSSVGAGLALGGYLFDVINFSFFWENDPEAPQMYVPIPSFAGWIFGGAMLVASVPLYWVGTVKLKKAAAAGGPKDLAFRNCPSSLSQAASASPSTSDKIQTAALPCKQNDTADAGSFRNQSRCSCR